MGYVYISSDNGASWSYSELNIFAPVWSVAISGTNFFAGFSGGVYLSTNSGTSWTLVNSGLTNTNVTSLAVSGSNLFAGTEGGGSSARPIAAQVGLSSVWA